jgi:hypothetical protein
MDSNTSIPVTSSATSSRAFNVQGALSLTVARTKKGPYGLTEFACRFKLTSFSDTIDKYKEVRDAAMNGDHEDLVTKIDGIIDSREQRLKLTKYLVR